MTLICSQYNSIRLVSGWGGFRPDILFSGDSIMVAPLTPSFKATRLSQAFPELFGVPAEATQRRWLSGRFMSPAAVWESDDKLHLEIDMPGVPQEAVNVSVHEGKLLVSFERKRTNDGPAYALDSLTYGKFEQVLHLPDTLDPTTIEAELKLGVLHITFGKKPEVQPQKVEVRVS
jgi:HSP20 family protein